MLLGMPPSVLFKHEAGECEFDPALFISTPLQVSKKLGGGRVERYTRAIVVVDKICALAMGQCSVSSYNERTPSDQLH